MTKLGFFDELPKEQAINQLRSLKRDIPSPQEGNILKYLKSGQQIIAVAGVVTDLLDDRNTIIGPPNIFTDGEWVWTEDVVHYVSKYHLELPRAMTDRMADHGWTSPSVDDPASIACSVWDCG